jgi:DNA topoisomerase I
MTFDPATAPVTRTSVPDSRSAPRARRAAYMEVSYAEKSARELAWTAGLQYVSDMDTGLTRKRRRGRFIYLHPDGSRLDCPREIRRIDALAIPPAYGNVWICRDADGHIQATARDARGRKQYRYHARWQAISTMAKFERMIAFCEALPRIRRTVVRHLRREGMQREKVLAAVVQLLDVSLIRVGNDEYARQNRSFGLTTLRTHHVEVVGTTMHFDFRGKSGVAHRIALRHPGLAAFMKSCMNIPGRDLFQYLDDDGRRHAVNAADVNAFLQRISHANFTAKDFRTWGASALALRELRKQSTPGHGGKKVILATIRTVAERLGNTPAVCRKSYVHPAVLDAFRAGTLQPLRVVQRRGLRVEESALLSLLTRDA